MRWLALLWHWLRLAPARRTDLRVTVYTRDSCPLCDKAWKSLQHLQHTYGFLLEAQDIDVSADLTKTYGDSVPVIAINGKVRFRGCVNPILLRRILDATSPLHNSRPSLKNEQEKD